EVRNRIADIGRKVMELDMQQLRDSKGIHLEQYENSADPRARTIRLGDNHRGMVAHAGDDLLVLVRVGTHDEIDRHMSRLRFAVNPANGAFEIVDVTSLQEIAQQPDEAAPSSTGMFGHRKEKDFV